MTTDFGYPVDTPAVQAYLDARYALKGSTGTSAGAVTPLTVLCVQKDPTTGFWPASYASDGTPVYTSGSASAGVRPTASANVMVIWKGADPSPAIVSSGTGGMLNNVDERHVT